MAKLIGRCEIMPVYSEGPRPDDFNFDEFYKRQTDVMKFLEDESHKALEDNNPVGFLLNFPMADGYATYRVAKAKPLQLEHVPFGDAYQVSAAHIRGLNLTDVKQQMERAKLWREVKRASY
jgi:hypothetical protein